MDMGLQTAEQLFSGTRLACRSTEHPVSCLIMPEKRMAPDPDLIGLREFKDTVGGIKGIDSLLRLDFLRLHYIFGCNAVEMLGNERSLGR
ncbi:hypothetical protein D3C75_963530 [compost metagenome]